MKLKHIAFSLLASSVTLMGGANVTHAATFSVFAEGLNNARGLTWGPDGYLYVAESGSGGGPDSDKCVPSPSVQGLGLCLGDTGAISRISPDGNLERVITDLPSLALENGFEGAGPHDLEFDSQGNAYLVYGYAGDPARRDSTLNALVDNRYDPDGVIGEDIFGKLHQVDFATGELTELADLATYELVRNPAQDDTTSNPYAMSIDNDVAYIVDGGANDLFAYDLNTGELDLASTFFAEDVPLDGLEFPGGELPPPNPNGDPSNMGPNPAFPNDPDPNQPPPEEMPQFPLQYVPTGVDIGPDGAAYVTEFTGFPYPDGAAEITRVDLATGEQTAFAEGFTQLADLVFAPDGTMYALQFANESYVLGGEAGKLLQIDPDGTVTTLLDGDRVEGFDLLTSLTYGPDDMLYVTSRGNRPDSRILQVDPNGHAVPEPTSILGALTALGVGSLFRGGALSRSE